MLYNFYTITDTFFVTTGIGSIASGAIGIFSPFLVLINGISSTLGTGGGSVISRRMGEKNTDGVKVVIGCMVWIWLLCSVVITVVGLFAIKPILFILGCTEEILPYAVTYGRIMLLSTVASTGFSGIMRAQGDSGYSTLQWSGPVVINLILDPIFIYLCKWGIAGAAYATLVAQLFCMFSSIYYFFFRKRTPCKISINEIRWNRSACREILGVGLPAFLNSLGSSFAGTICNQILGQVGGTQAISTYAIVSRIQGFLATPFSGIMQGIQPMLGYDWGRREHKRIKKTIRYAFLFSICYGIGMTVLLSLGAAGLMQFFTKDVTIVRMGKVALQILSFGLMIGGMMPVVQAFFQAIGKGRSVLILSMVSVFVIRLPLLLVAGKIGHLYGVWGSLLLADWLIAGVGVLAMKRYHNISLSVI